LDEPSIGLHPRDTGRLIEIMKTLRDLGNTVLVVEPRPGDDARGRQLLDLGPGAGEHGGRIIYAGDMKGLLADPHSLTGGIFPESWKFPFPRQGAAGKILAENSRRAPAQPEVHQRGYSPGSHGGGVSGVSGSGKSTLSMMCFTTP